MKHSTSTHTLDNGLELLAVQMPNTAVVSLGLHLLAGDVYVGDDSKYEAAHIMEHMAFGANKVSPSMREASQAISKNGAVTNASTSRLSMVYSLECARFDWENVVDCLITQIESPLFIEEEFQAEAGNVRDELIMRWDNPEVRLVQLTMQHLGHDDLTFKESLETVANVSRQDIVDHHQKTHKTADMRIIIVGDLKESDWDKIKAKFGAIDLPKGQRQTPKWRSLPDTNVEPLYIDYNESESIILDLNFFDDGRMSENEIAAARVFEALCFESFHSLIYGKLREQGLAYHMSGNINDHHTYSGLGIGTQIDPRNAVAAVKVVKDGLDDLLKSIDAKRMTETIDYCCGRFAFNTQTAGALGGGYSRRFFTYGEVEDYFNIPDRLRAVTAKEVQDLVKRFYSPEKLVVSAIGPAAHKDLVKEINDVFTTS